MDSHYEQHHMRRHYPIKIIPHEEFGKNNYEYSLLNRHWHRSIEIVLALSDGFSIWKEGKNYEMSEGNLLIINSEENHEFIIPENSHQSGVSLVISYEFLKRQIPLFDHYYFMLPEEIKISQRIKDLLIAIRNEYQEDLEWGSFLMQAKANELLYLLFSEGLMLREHVVDKRDEKYALRYKQVITYLNENFQREISLREVADLVNLNAEFFSRDFKKYIGLGFKQYLKKLRLGFALQELMNTNKSIIDISLESGFPDAKAFSKAFKEKYVLTPLIYRQSQKK